MDHTGDVLQRTSRDVERQPTNAKPITAGTAAEYFERYEWRVKGKDDMEDGKVDYWLSEEEAEESHQLGRPKWKTRSKKGPYIAQNAKAPKLRPSGDVMKRLRWDPGFEMANFVVGYLERFDGVKEMPLTSWVTESSSEDFIPQHRIKYFKRNSGGEIVWDREQRVDKIFGSGLTGRMADGPEDER